MRVSVSVDGPRARNGDRVDRGRRAGVRPDHARDRRAAPARHRRSRRCAWSSDPGPGLAAELYDYFLDLGCDVLGINIEEQEGVNPRANAHAGDGGARRSGPSWSAAWRRDPRIHLREIEWTLRYAGGGARRHRRRAAAAPARPDPDDRATTARWCCSRPSWPASPIRGTATSRQRQRADHPAGRDPRRGAAGTPWIARVPAPASRRAGRPARTSASAAAPTRPTATSSTAGSTAPRPTTAATARSAYWRECSTMPETTEPGSLTRVRTDPVTARVPDPAPGWPRCSQEAEAAPAARAEADGGRRLGGLRLEPLREHPDVLQLEQPAALRRAGPGGQPIARSACPRRASSVPDRRLADHAGTRASTRGATACSVRSTRSAPCRRPGSVVVVRVVLVIVVDELVVVVVEVDGRTYRHPPVRAARR